MPKTTIVCISGISGAGKSTLVKALSEHLKAPAIFWDEFDEISSAPNDYVDWLKRGKNYAEFNDAALAKCLSELKNGNSTIHPITQSEIHPEKYIFVDAPLGKAHNQTAKYIDLFLHINIPLDVALARRLLRYNDNPKFSKDYIMTEIDDYLKTTRSLFTETEIAHKADFILDGTKEIKDKIDDILAFLQSLQVSIQDNIQIDMVDTISEAIEKKMRSGFIEYETKNGIDVNYKRFSLVMRENQTVIGVLNAFTAFSEIYIDDLWVDKAYRGKGLGRLLINNLENRFKGKGFNNINLVTSDFQAPGFYQKCGFVPEFRRINKKNPKLSKTFLVKFFDEDNQYQGILNDSE